MSRCTLNEQALTSFQRLGLHLVLGAVPFIADGLLLGGNEAAAIELRLLHRTFLFAVLRLLFFVEVPHWAYLLQLALSL